MPQRCCIFYEHSSTCIITQDNLTNFINNITILCYSSIVECVYGLAMSDEILFSI